MPSLNHGTTQAFLIGALLRYRERFTVASELSLDLEGLRVTPDLCIYPKMEIDFTHDVLRMTEPPLVAIWIENPTEPIQKMQDRIRPMLQAGVKVCWLVQPAIRAVTVFSGARKTETFTEGTITDPATKIEVVLKDVFPD